MTSTNFCFSAHSDIGSEQLRIVTEHNHPRISSQHVVRERQELIKDRASNNPVEGSREINAISRAGLSNEQLMLMPSGSAVQRQVTRCDICG